MNIEGCHCSWNRGFLSPGFLPPHEKGCTRKRSKDEERPPTPLPERFAKIAEDMEQNYALEQLIEALKLRLGDTPEVDEVLLFILGNDIDRLVLWNMEKLDKGKVDD